MSAKFPPFAELASMRAVATPRAPRVLAGVLIALAVSAALVLAFTPWQQTAVGQGRVIAYAPLDRQQAIEAPLDGRVTRWRVQEGDAVKRGDPIAEVSDNDPDLLGRLREERRALTARLEASRERARSLSSRGTALGQSGEGAVAAAKARRRMATERVEAAVEAVRAADAAIEAARLNLNRQRALAAKGLAATRMVELATLEVTRAATDRQRAIASLAAARAEALALAADETRAGTDAAAAVEDARAGRAAAEAEAANIQAEIARLDVRLARQAAQAVVAPRDGVVLRILGGQDGDMVKSGDPLAVIVPDTRARAVELWVKGNDVPLIQVGRVVRLQFEGWPAIQFSGWPSVAVGTFGGRVALVDATDDGAGNFRIVVLPDAEANWPEARYLRQGVRSNGWVLLDQVPLGFELWRQFNGFPPTAKAPPAGEDKLAPPTKRLKP